MKRFIRGPTSHLVFVCMNITENNLMHYQKSVLNFDPIFMVCAQLVIQMSQWRVCIIDMHHYFNVISLLFCTGAKPTRYSAGPALRSAGLAFCSFLLYLEPSEHLDFACSLFNSQSLRSLADKLHIHCDYNC